MGKRKMKKNSISYNVSINYIHESVYGGKSRR